ncbi:hypothetical protein B0H15DRAFT_419005 [Mycena belliarum]|uniref:DUF3752 domain-containing protein n=1 Tax=Mycena belliarum TaxID=1033014 RepID=A0AAD6U3U2_9AGAR|nr:hypothetical protein B0H15DRAFT_419005 [Mycena belliae]
MSAIGPALPPHLQPSAGTYDDDDEEDGPQLPPAAVAGPQLPAQVAGAGPQLPPTALQVGADGDDDDGDDYAPALPPDMLASSSASTSRPSAPKKPVVGPTMPPSYGRDAAYDPDSDDDVGPRPLPAGIRRAPEPDAVAEFMAKEEKRRREVEDAAKPKAPKREEWMLVPPTSSVLGNLDPTKLKPRTFARSAAPARSTDNSLWTETPAQRAERLADEVAGRKRRAANAAPALSDTEILESRKRQRIDAELRKGVEEHTARVRGVALVDAHAVAHAKAKEDEEEKAKKGIWDRDRDMALSGRLMDDSKRNKMIQEAKGLSDRFGTGKTGGFY